jgi:DNA-binding MarR family transcriptional regulator
MTDERPVAAEASRLDLGDLPSLLGFHLRLAHVAMYRDFTDALAGLELTQKQGAVLQLIAANPGVSQADLAATLGSDRATMMALVDRLEERGFVARQRSAQDRRRQELSLTERGASVLADAMRAIAAHERRFTARFSPAELKSLIEALSRIHQQV